MGVYQIIGRRGAGSLIAEFLLDVAGEPYEIEFLSRGKIHDPAFREVNPVGKIPVMTCPDGSRIFETIAIVAHLIERFPSLAPAMNTPERDLHWQYLALFATNLYPAYHRQHHTAYYVSENGFEDVRRRARAEQAITFDYIEGLLDPYLFGDSIMAADFYLYMLLRWDVDKPALVAERPKIAAFMTAMRGHPSVDRVITAQRPKQPGN